MINGIIYLHIIYSIASCPFRNSSWKRKATVVVQHFISLHFFFFFNLKVKETRKCHIIQQEV